MSRRLRSSTRGVQPAARAGSTIRTSASPPEIRSARFESTSITGASSVAAGAGCASAASNPNTAITTAHLRDPCITPPSPLGTADANTAGPCAHLVPAGRRRPRNAPDSDSEYATMVAGMRRPHTLTLARLFGIRIGAAPSGSCSWA